MGTFFLRRFMDFLDAGKFMKPYKCFLLAKLEMTMNQVKIFMSTSSSIRTREEG
jgi:hypothetical protein